MGNEESSPIDESVPPRTLSARTLAALAAHLTNERTRKVVVMTGAGISTSAGIPDFRSPGTGLYANLARLNLPFAEAVFDIAFFRQSPEPFYTLAHELYPGNFRPTITHSFIRLLHDKGKLLKCFTQNIDCLEREAGVPGGALVEAHGSFARQSCIDCRAPFDAVELRRHIDARTIPRCPACHGLVKPEIVFFGEQLPADFFAARGLPADADCAIVMGTSLTVQPFASLPAMVREGVPRLLINLERVGGLGAGTDDVLLLGDCDAGVRQLAEACGWLEELEELWAQTAPQVDGAAAAAADGRKGDGTAATATATEAKSPDEALEDEVEKLTKEVDETLNLSKWHEEKVRNERLPTEAVRSTEEAGESKTATQESGKQNLNHVYVGQSDAEASKPAQATASEKGEDVNDAKDSSGDASKL